MVDYKKVYETWANDDFFDQKNKTRIKRYSR